MDEKNTDEKITPEDVDINELRQIRREKLAALRESGRDPFLVESYNVSHKSGYHRGFRGTRKKP